MSLSDSFGDFITRIRNAYIAGKDFVYVHFSKMNEGSLRELKKEGFIEDYTVLKLNPQDSFFMIKVFLRYHKNKSAIVEIKRISKPSKRIYSSVKNIKPLYNGFGVYLLSTVKGIVTDHLAKELNVGGELLCYIF